MFALSKRRNDSPHSGKAIGDVFNDMRALLRQKQPRY